MQACLCIQGRYADDSLLFDDDKKRLDAAREAVRQFLRGLRLKPHPRKSVIFPVSQGIRFVGYRVFPTHRFLDKANVKRFRRRLRRMQLDYAAGEISGEDIRVRLISWIGHASHASTYELIKRLLRDHPFVRPQSTSADPQK